MAVHLSLTPDIATYPLNRTAEAFAEYEGNPSRILRIIIDAATDS